MIGRVRRDVCLTFPRLASPDQSGEPDRQPSHPARDRSASSRTEERRDEARELRAFDGRALPANTTNSLRLMLAQHGLLSAQLKAIDDARCRDVSVASTVIACIAWSALARGRRRGGDGRPIEVDLREVLNAIRYMARSGGGWRMLPNDFPPWQTVYWWFRRFIRRFMFQTIHDVALMLDRERVGREASPTGGVVDSQSVKAPEAKTRGYDAGKRDRGSQAPHRGRHRRPSSDGQSDARRHLRQRRGSDDPGRCAQALAVAEASVRRWGL